MNLKDQSKQFLLVHAYQKMAALVANCVADGKIGVVIDIPEGNKFGYVSDVKLKLDASKLGPLGEKPQINLEELYKRRIKYWKEN